MSAAAPADDTTLKAILAGIDRDLAESGKLREESNKFIVEQRKLIAETQKFTEEARKLDAEHDKLRRDRNLAPWLLAASVSGGIIAAAIGQLLQHFWK